MRSAHRTRPNWLSPARPRGGFEAAASGGVAVAVGAIAASAIGAVALGAVAVGALAVRQLAVRRARTRVLIVDKLVINRLVVRNVERPAQERERAASSAATNGSGAEIARERTVDPAFTRLKPGDDAAAGTVGTGDEICPECGGSGVIDSQRCANCEGTGHITKAIGGG